MAGSKHLLSGVLVLAVVGVLVYLVDPTMFGLLKSKQGFADLATSTSTGEMSGGGYNQDGVTQEKNDKKNPNSVGGDANSGNPLTAQPSQSSEGFANLASMEGPADFGTAGAPAGCYPRDQLTPSDLLPKDQNSVWAEQNPMGPGSLKGKNFLSAGALIGVNTVGQSLRNASYDLRSEPANPQVAVSPWFNSTIEPDTNRKTFEIA
jgi:hypothetical protein